MDILGHKTTRNCSIIGMLFYETMWKVKKPRTQWNPALEKVWLRYFRSTTLRTIGDIMFDKSFLLYIQTWPEIAKFQNKPFPLYDKLGDLYDGEHVAEGNFNFTSTEVTQVSDGDPEVEREKIAFSFDLNQYDDDLHMYDDPRDAAPSDGPRDAAPSDGPRDAAPSDGPRGAAPSDGSRDATQRGGVAASNNKHVKESKKGKKRDDPMVEVMAQYVEIKWKQAEEESALLAGAKNAQEFSLNYAAEDEESVAVLLRSEMAELTQHI
ncbi:uncharacterized protein LOC119283435 [Triticum dicoccoides]|uniref:uncharacterized protein LOC119283435 n=1 Tax=Triticum dicoccoides TaxID=85692 RepID=UPI00188F93F9|nr:uncharacterized protein LOC119283435 [Triticum dicoccoides]